MIRIIITEKKKGFNMAQPLQYYSKTTAPRFSPQVMQQMQQAYGTGLQGLTSMARGGGQRRIGTGRRQLAQQQQIDPYSAYQAPQVADIAPGEFPQIPQAQFPEMDFGPIEQQEVGRFQQETLPTIAQRFAGMGTGGNLSSSAYLKTIGAAGAGLGASLAAMKAKLLPQWAMQKAQYGLQRSGLELQRAGLGQKERQMKLQRDLGAGGLEAQFAGLGIQRAQVGMKGQAEKRQALMALLGFKPSQQYGQPIVRHGFYQG